MIPPALLPTNLRAMSFSWPVDRSCLPALPDPDDETYESRLAQQSAAEDLAVQVLYNLSGRQFGLREVTVRPCPPKLDPRWRYGHPLNESVPPYSAMVWASNRWVYFDCGCHGRCRQAGPRTAHLPGPVHQIVTVTIGTQELDYDQYALEGDLLYRIGAEWPGQDYNRPLGEDGTWSVTYEQGVEPPAGVGVFVGQLAKEFLAACSGDSCRLPRNVVSVTNRGVSRQFDPSRIYAAGKTGLSEVDLWLSAVNPHHIMAAPRVL